ncbi:SRPBCC family protein [Mycobacterium sp. 29Ha]|uniref:SRPBCC family protein n=1 Tax=Mycobacterium sp. 29Ha TaxID=2939268 RepID=UPI00293933E2|nr:SRPBCC family protein [Mycobacterium sp. 29Ha]MDV3133548.1 SRPBCC family protein [Mycobacterium sp. 29Ha]
MDFRFRQRMPTVERHIPAPREAVWNVLVDLDLWPKWGPSIQRAELAEAGPMKLGSRGKVWTAIGVALPFTITEFEENRCWAWEVAGVRATRHEVWPTDGGTRLAFAVPWWAPAYLSVCAVALQRIDRLATDRAAGG